MLGRAKRRTGEQVLESDKIASRQGASHPGFHSGGETDGVHDALEELGMADVDLVASQARRLEASRRQCNDLGVRDRSRRADQLRAHLVGLAPLVESPLVGGKHRTRIAKAQGQGAGAQLARHQAGNWNRALADQGQNLAARVAELEQAPPLICVQAQLEHVDALDHRRDHVPVAPTAHLFEQ